MFRCPNRIPSDPAAHHYLLIQHCKSAPAELLWALSQKSCQRRGWHIQCQRSHRPAQLGCPHPIQPSLCLVPSLGSSVTLKFLGLRGRNVGQPLLQAWSSTNQENQSWTRISVSAPRDCWNRGAWAPTRLAHPCRTTGFPKVSHLAESSTLSQSPNSNSLSNAPISML